MKSIRSVVLICLTTFAVFSFFSTPTEAGWNEPNRGFVVPCNADKTKWCWSNTQQAFVPQFAMAGSPMYYNTHPGDIQKDVQRFIVDHGFTGLHVPVFCNWYDITKIDNCSGAPDPKTFDILEDLITTTYNAGGSVHLWMYGDDSDGTNPDNINGPEDRAVQKMIADRLGPLEGWTMGYGFDLFENWINKSQIESWGSYLHQQMQPNSHLLGARGYKNSFNLITEALDYSSYEQHHPTYATYVETITKRPNKPSFSEDRFRIRERAKDYTYDETRQGLYHSTMAGGIANIWGDLSTSQCNLANDGFGTTCNYANKDQIKTYHTFFNLKNRFNVNMQRCNNLVTGGGDPAKGVCLGDGKLFVLYKENTNTISFTGSTQNIIAVDTKAAYKEISVSKNGSTISLPSTSDWIIAIGGSGITQPTPTTSQTVTNTPVPTQSPSNTPQPSTLPSATSVPSIIPTPACIIGDLDCSRKVNAVDLTILLRDFGKSGSIADLDESGVVNAADLTILLQNFGMMER